MCDHFGWYRSRLVAHVIDFRFFFWERFLSFSLFSSRFARETSFISYGATWSSPYARSLGISSQEGLKAVLDDLGIRQIRIPVYWALIERSPGKYAWEELDQQLDAIARRGGRVTLAIGQKVPRWPECWLPDWVKTASTPDRGEAAIKFLRDVVRHTASHPAVKAYQVENEPLFPFVDCPFISLST